MIFGVYIPIATLDRLGFDVRRQVFLRMEALVAERHCVSGLPTSEIRWELALTICPLHILHHRQRGGDLSVYGGGG
jgi:hypothetical protein